MDVQPMTPSGHVLLLTLPAWGCLRPLCAFAAKAIQAKEDIIVTYLTFGDFDKRIQAECDRYIPKVCEPAKSRLRFINIGGQGFDFGLLPVIMDNFPEYYSKLVQGQPIRCKSTGFIIPPAKLPPTCVLTDYMYLPVLRAIRATTMRTVPVLHWYSGSAFFQLWIFGPEKYGGCGDRPSRYGLLVGEDGEYEDEELKEIMEMKGELVKMRGFPPFYDYEWYPYPPNMIEGLPASVHDIFRQHRFIEECDGFVYTSGESYEAEAIHATREWLKESGNRKLYAIGPMLPPGIGQLPTAGVSLLGTEQSSGNIEFQQFMDKILSIRGKNSLVYMSFGSLWWPMGGYAQLFVEALLKFQIPFIFAIASPYQDIPPDLIKKAVDSGLAMFPKWTPQQMILSHPVTGWVVTHCGHNTVLESLAQGKPLIAWPITFDEPANAAHTSLTLDVAFELIQVRTGTDGLKPLYRWGGIQPMGTTDAVITEIEDVLKRMRGEEGERKRRNAEKLKDRFKEGWEEGGMAWREFIRLLDDVNYPGLNSCSSSV
ncbi:UDP-Glycosyltransferase/glycogen phosphorylase [Marasmius fiardii PR-910]|nr:UDP-Glycosyltransferase/glycogen phosphorylase [Marasmius fiardii PR-910]